MRVSWLIAIAVFLFAGLGAAYYWVRPQTKPWSEKNGHAHFKEQVIYRDGDIIFQSSLSRQSRAIELATASPYSHCGILFQQNKKWWVLEAVEPVKVTRLEKWIKQGKDHSYVVKRLRKPVSDATWSKMEVLGKQWIGRHYDAAFNWNDSALYCSELVWKLYERCAGVRLGEPAPLGSYRLDAPEVAELLKKRYGNDIPYQEPMIAPVSIFNSPLLVKVSAGQLHP